MVEKTIEWNLGFARDEVIIGLEKLFAQSALTFTRVESEAEVCFHVSLSSGSLRLTVQPLLSSHGPFNLQNFSRRTLLQITFVGISAQEEETFLRRLTLAFLRVGG